MQTQVVRTEDYQNWLNLAKEVEPLFGPMINEPTFQKALKDFIKTEQAFCIKDNAEFCAAIAISKEKNEILWFAVSKSHQGKGYGKLLLEYALKKLDSSKKIYVQTFAEGTTEGKPARILYEALGFKDLKQMENTPAGYATVMMVK